MPPNKMDNYVNNDQLTRLIAKDSGITIKAVAEMREAENEIIKTLIKMGKVVSLGEIGKFSLKDHPAKKGREFKRPYDGKIVYLDPKPPYQSPQFKFLPLFKQEIKQAVKVESNG